MEYSNLNVNLLDLEGAAEHIGLDSALLPNTHDLLGIGGLGAELEVGVLLAAADGINSNQAAGGEELLSLEAAGHRSLLGPHRVHVLREELGRGQLLLLHASSIGDRGKISSIIISRDILETLGNCVSSGLSRITGETLGTRLGHMRILEDSLLLLLTGHSLGTILCTRCKRAARRSSHHILISLLRRSI